MDVNGADSPMKDSSPVQLSQASSNIPLGKVLLSGNSNASKVGNGVPENIVIYTPFHLNRLEEGLRMIGVEDQLLNLP